MISFLGFIDDLEYIILQSFFRVLSKPLHCANFIFFFFLWESLSLLALFFSTQKSMSQLKLFPMLIFLDILEEMNHHYVSISVSPSK